MMKLLSKFWLYIITVYFKTLFLAKKNIQDIAVYIFSIIIVFIVFFYIRMHIFTIDYESILNVILTINGIFSAVLITFLITQVSLESDRKSITHNDAISISQKITEYRRILNRLTTNYGIWFNENSTKHLLDHGKYRHVDFYSFRMYHISVKQNQIQLFENLFHEHEYNNVATDTYLAMISMVSNRNAPYHYQAELYKDFEIKGLYDIQVIAEWLECNLCGIISNNFSPQDNLINYHALRGESSDYIIQAASRINPKYQAYTLNNELIRELSDDMESHYLSELHKCLFKLRTGITGLIGELLIIVFSSLSFGVLIPFLMLITFNVSFTFIALSILIICINIGMLMTGIIKLPLLIERQLKWI